MFACLNASPKRPNVCRFCFTSTVKAPEDSCNDIMADLPQGRTVPVLTVNVINL